MAARNKRRLSKDDGDDKQPEKQKPIIKRDLLHESPSSNSAYVTIEWCGVNRPAEMLVGSLIASSVFTELRGRNRRIFRCQRRATEKTACFVQGVIDKLHKAASVIHTRILYDDGLRTVNSLAKLYSAKVDETGAEIQHLNMQSYSSNRLKILSLVMPTSFRWLESLCISHAVVSSTKFLAQLPRVQRLVMGDCWLHTFPCEIAEMKELKILDLSENRLKELPSDVCWLPSLLDIRIVFNHEHLMQHLPLSIGREELSVRFYPPMDHRFGWPSDTERQLASRPYNRPENSLRIRWRLAFVLLNGLVESDKGVRNPWTVFLRRGLYDPRLFLLVWAFIENLWTSQLIQGKLTARDALLIGDVKFD